MIESQFCKSADLNNTLASNINLNDLMEDLTSLRIPLDITTALKVNVLDNIFPNSHKTYDWL